MSVTIKQKEILGNSFSSPENCAQAGYWTDAFSIRELPNDSITVELNCCVYSTIQRLIVFGYEIWVNNKPLYRNTLNCGHSSVGYIGEHGGTDYCEKTNRECENTLKVIFNRTWKPVFTRINEDLVLISTPEDAFDKFVVPSIIINVRSRKGTIIDDMQEYELLKKYKPDVSCYTEERWDEPVWKI